MEGSPIVDSTSSRTCKKEAELNGVLSYPVLFITAFMTGKDFTWRGPGPSLSRDHPSSRGKLRLKGSRAA